MTRDDAWTQARELLLTALGTVPGEGGTEAFLRQSTNIGTSLFHEVIPDLLGQGLVLVSHGEGCRIQPQYHLVNVQNVVFNNRLSVPIESGCSSLLVWTTSR